MSLPIENVSLQLELPHKRPLTALQAYVADIAPDFQRVPSSELTLPVFQFGQPDILYQVLVKNKNKLPFKTFQQMFDSMLAACMKGGALEYYLRGSEIEGIEDKGKLITQLKLSYSNNLYRVRGMIMSNFSDIHEDKKV
jgi:hypothetical protein